MNNRGREMANRTIQQKILKIKRRHRYARFSGATSRFAGQKVHEHLIQEGEDKVTIKSQLIPVGPVSLSNQVINTGRGPDKERLQTYYARVTAKSFNAEMPIRRGWTTAEQELLERYDTIVKETPPERRISIVDDSSGKLDLFFTRTEAFFLDIDYKNKTFKRSVTYTSVAQALTRMKLKRITWVEQLS